MFQEAIDQKLRQEQTDLNYLFIELLSRAHKEQPEQGAEGVLGLRREWVADIARMRHRKRHEIAECPFALYGLHLHDARFWSSVRPHHIPDDYATHSTRCSAELEQRLMQFSLTALMHAWYVASSNTYGARLLLGMPPAALQRVASLPVTLIEGGRRSPTCSRRDWRQIVMAGPHRLCRSRQQAAAIRGKLLGAQLIAASSAPLA
jgi:hypothetical protein